MGALGANYPGEEGGPFELRYAHDWLFLAGSVDSLGRAGRLAQLMQLRAGFHMDGMCGGGDNSHRRVSALAEALLRSTTDSATAAELHWLAGEGYADIVRLARGAHSHYDPEFAAHAVDSTAYTAEAPGALRHAMQHYRQSLALAPRASSARDIWRKGWLLLAGLPSGTHFFCQILE